ncbi:MAG: polymorphic toxin type 46 domain-containing protein [Pseudobdellovibrionaceae bacterium]
MKRITWPMTEWILVLCLFVPSFGFGETPENKGKYLGGASAAEEMRLDRLSRNDRSYFYVDNQIFWGTLEKKVVTSEGNKQFYFRDIVPGKIDDPRFAPPSPGAVPGESAQEGLKNPTQNGSPRTKDSGSGGGLAESAGRGAIAGTGAGIFIWATNEISKPNAQTEAELNAARKDFEKSKSNLQKSYDDGQKFGSEMVESSAEILSDINKAYDKIPKWSDQANSSGGERPDFGAIKNSNIKERSESAWEQLDDFDPKNRTEIGIKEMGLAAVRAGSEFGADGDDSSALAALTFGEAAVDFLLGLNPVTSLLQDGYGLFFGKDTSGRGLQPWERALYGASMLMTLATGGLAAPMKSVLKATTRMSGLLRSAPALKALSEVVPALKAANELGANIAKGTIGLKGFSKKVLGGKVTDLSSQIYFNSKWSPEMKAAYPKFSKQVDAAMVDGMHDGLYDSYLKKGVPDQLIQERYELAKASLYGAENFAKRSVDIADHLKLIDYSHSVSLEKVNRGEVFHQLGVPSAKSPGNYATRTIETPSRVGIGEMGLDRLTKSHEKVVSHHVVVKQDTVALRSVTAGGIDNRHNGFQEFSGGATQYMIGKSNLKMP